MGVMIIDFLKNIFKKIKKACTYDAQITLNGHICEKCGGFSWDFEANDYTYYLIKNRKKLRQSNEKLPGMEFQCKDCGYIQDFSVQSVEILGKAGEG